MKRKELTWIFGCFTLLLFAAAAWTAPVPDTKQTLCYNVAGSVIACPTPGQAFYGQDANYTINPMSYTKLDGNGIALPGAAVSWVTVRDNVTGLVWEKKTKMDGKKDYGNPNDPDNTYTWYDSNPVTNGGYAGTPGNGTDTESFIKALNVANYGGFSDWRLPTIKELAYTVNYSITSPGPMIDTAYFPNTVSPSLSFYWSSTPSASNTGNAWSLDFYYGYDHYNVKSNYGYVRAVRGGRPTGFIDNGNGTVTDTYTALTWQQSAPNNVMSWEVALSYCEGLNLGSYTDWRLPTIKELRSLVDYNRYGLAIDTTYFPNTLMSLYWSSTTFTNSPDYAWGMSFDYGGDYYGYKVYGGYVRAVRGGLASGGQARLAASFAGSWLWVYDSFSSTWNQISLFNPESMIYSGSTLYVDFGAAYGLYKWDGAAWTQLTAANPENMVASGSTLYVDFGAAYGLYKWDGAAWTQLTAVDPENMVTSGSTLYVDFGTAYGLYKWDGAAWTQLTAVDPENMVTSGSTLYVDFGTAYGLYKWDGAAWTQLTAVDPENMVASGSTLYVDFGAAYGLYKWDGTSWDQLTTANPEKMVVSGSTLYADFVASGICKWDGTWSQLPNSTNSENMVASGSTLYVDVGAFGLWNWDGTSWFQLIWSDPLIMAVSN